MGMLAGISISDLMIIGSAALFGLAAFLLIRTLYPERLLDEVRERAAEARTQAAGDSPRGAAGAAGDSPGKLGALGAAILGKLGDKNVRWVKPAWQEKMKRRFTAMGRPGYRPQDFVAQQEIWGVCFGVLGLLLMNMLRQPLWQIVPFAVFGAMFPYIWLSDQIKKRQAAISRALPYNIDLLTLSVEAGLDFQAALGTVVEKGRPGPLIEELGLMLAEIRLGKTRAEALRNLSDRIQLAEVSAFVGNLIQADRMGTSLGKVLRIQSTQLRIARTHRAEKLANEAPVKMLLPLIGCIFPTVFIVLFGPIVYRVIYGG